MLKTLSDYDLVYELLHGGKGEIYPDIEPIDLSQIYKILQERTGLSFNNDVENVINWFMFTDGVATDEQKSNLKIILRIISIEKKALEKIKGKDKT